MAARMMPYQGDTNGVSSTAPDFAGNGYLGHPNLEARIGDGFVDARGAACTMHHHNE